MTDQPKRGPGRPRKTEDKPKTIDDRRTELQAVGLDEDTIQATLDKEFPPPELPAPPQPKVCALSGDDLELEQIISKTLAANDGKGLDTITRAICAALHGYGGIELDAQMYQWVQNWQMWERGSRRNTDPAEITEATIVAMMIRHHWGAHPQERASIQGAISSGLAKNYDPKTGQWAA